MAERSNQLSHDRMLPGDRDRLAGDRMAKAARHPAIVPAALPDEDQISPKRLAAFATYLLDARRRRDALLVDIEFGEPAWDMLLDLYVQHVEGRGVSVTGLCVAAAVPATTALRWINVMVERGHLSREPDFLDRRRVFIRLDDHLLATIERHLLDARKRAIKALQ